jgi:hypothetical protein
VKKIKNAESLQQEAARLNVVFVRLGQAFGSLQEIRRKTNALTSVCEARREPKRAERANQRIAELTPDLARLTKEVQNIIQGVPYPFHHPVEDLTLDAYARNDIAASNKLQALYNDCACQLNRLLPLYGRVLGRVTFIALKVEEAI